MPLDRSYVGRVFPYGEPYRVGIEKIRDFAAAIGDADPSYPQAAGAPVIAPPTFTIAVIARAQAAVFFDPGLGLDFSRVVHRDQSFRQYRPIRPDDELSCTVHVDAIRVLAGNDVIALRTEVVDAAGGPVCTAVGTLFCRAAG